MEMVPMRHSKALAEIGYDPDRRTLRVRFRHGGVYDYLMVPRSLYEALRDDPHPWTVWGAELRRHPFTRLA